MLTVPVVGLTISLPLKLVEVMTDMDDAPPGAASGRDRGIAARGERGVSVLAESGWGAGSAV